MWVERDMHHWLLHFHLWRQKGVEALHCLVDVHRPAVFRYTVRFNEEEHNRFLSMFEKSGVYAKSVFLKYRYGW